ncbi:MAG: TonB-dependent receptor [Deltaproteobacteria bacterium]|nr:TonB-dependent receptor [Deltaproteobacteria bacterium]
MFLTLVSITLTPLNAAAESCEQWVAKAVSVQGTVEVKRNGETQWQQVQFEDTFCAGDTIRVLEESRADLAFANQPLLRLDQNSTITLAEIEQESEGLAELFKGAAKLDLLKGAAHFFSRLPRNLEVRTAFVNAGVEGTEFFIKVADNSTTITVFEGKVQAANEVGSVGITGGQSAVAEAGKAPVMQVVAQPRDAVRWALHYPPVLDGPGPDSMTNQAAQLLAVGRVDEAGSKIDEALRKDPSNSAALSLQTIIAVVQNDKEAALSLANKAVEAAPEFATAQIALSYAQQAAFDLEAARASLEKAVSLEPDNALAWARLAELQSSFGDLDSALASAQKAVELNPNLSRTQTVLGFAYLTQIKTTMAREAFNKAIEFDQADSLPRLGLGLAKIRDGEREDGRREIEVAASLDSNSGLIRSYLGKAYYEEKRPELDGREFAIAKELDPNDPTPWFYDAIRKQTINQPVEALHDLQTAIGLNDNRAVYRSKLMLDSDLAARSASLARIYSDLGFQQRALVEGYNSVNTDPTNYSAHRFLADSYSALPRHEIARVSELLQSQLLQPANMTPIQPQLAESSLDLISSGGAASVSFSEFNPLFNRDQAAILASGLIGENSTKGGEAVISGIYKKLSFSAGYSSFDTDGWGTNHDQDDVIANIFGQLELTHKTSIQAEYRNRETDNGDWAQYFFEDNFFPTYRQEDEMDTYRIGIRHEFAPRSILIGNFSYQDMTEDLTIGFYDPVGFFEPYDLELIFPYNTDQEAHSGELQHLFSAEKIKTVGGVGYFSIDQDLSSAFEVYYLPDVPPSLVFADGPYLQKFDIDHVNFYLYSYIQMLKDITVTLGASFDSFELDETTGDQKLDSDQFNPKVGISWDLTPDTTLRGAAFRTFKRTLITDQTLEPTQVAGFNQFYDDPNATEAKIYGIGIDQKFSQSIYGGAEFTYRDMDVPYFDDLVLFAFQETEWDEYLGRAYLYWTPYKMLSLSMEYLYEKLDRNQDFTEGTSEVKTHRLPLGINFFHPSGLSLSLKATYWNQDGIFERINDAFVFASGDDSFWVVDAAVRYRLPKRYGFITVGVTNLFDESFQYFETDYNNTQVMPEQFIFGKVTLAFP